MVGQLAGSIKIITYSIGTGVLGESITCPTDKQLNDVYMINTGEGWAVGENGTILKYGH